MFVESLPVSVHSMLELSSPQVAARDVALCQDFLLVRGENLQLTG